MQKDTKPRAGDRWPEGSKFYPQAQIKEEAYAINKTNTFFTNNHKLDVKDIGETIFKLHEKNEHLQAQIYDLQNQNCEYE